MTESKTKRNFGLLDDLRYARIGSARIAPNGQSVICDVTRNDLENEKTSTSLWRIDLQTNELAPVDR